MTIKISRYKRFLNIINLVQSREGLSAREIAEKTGVSLRTTYRDLETMAEADIPLYFDRGYRMVNSEGMPPMILGQEQKGLLTVAIQASPFFAVEPYRTQLENTLALINGCPPMPNRKKAPPRPPTVDVAAGISVGKFLRPDLLPLIESAVVDNRVAQIAYCNIRGQISRRTIYPYALLFRGRAFYLLAFCRRRDEYRLFRLERIREFILEKATFIRDKDFKIREYFAHSWGVAGGEPYDIKIFFSSRVASMLLTGQRHPTEKIKRLKNGAIEYSMKASGLEEIGRWVVGFGREARVIYPQKLADMVADLAEGARHNHGRRPPGRK